jgi:hypothetical protein
MRGFIVRVAVATAVAGAVVLLVPAGEAAARPPAIHLYNAQSALDATPSKEVSVSCPDDSEVLSGGAYVVGGDRRVHIVRSQPSPTVNGWIAGAQTAPGEARTGNWRLYVYVKCGQHVFIDLGFLGDTQFVTFHTAANSDAVNEATAPCPAGTLVVSAGGRVSGGDGEVVLDDVAVDTTTQSAHVRAVEVEGGSANAWSVWAYAVCAEPGSVFGYEVVEQDTVSTTGDKGYALHCPGTKLLIGLGASMVGANGDAHFTRIEPQGKAASVESIVDETGAPAPWVTHVQAVCAFPYGS